VQKNGQKRNKIPKEKTIRNPLIFFGKKLLTWIFLNSFYGVLILPLLRNAQKRHKENMEK
jgi:hypothetical protein